LLHPGRNRLRGRLELARKLLRPPFLNSRVHETGSTPEHAQRSPLISPTVRGNGVSRWSAAGSMTREAMLLFFDSVDVTVSTLCWI
jgi:hypothetical protein